jgi:hypothetical protein
MVGEVSVGMSEYTLPVSSENCFTLDNLPEFHSKQLLVDFSIRSIVLQSNGSSPGKVHPWQSRATSTPEIPRSGEQATVFKEWFQAFLRTLACLELRINGMISQREV